VKSPYDIKNEQGFTFSYKTCQYRDMKEILQKEEGVLREISKEVPVENIQCEEVQKIISEMRKALEEQPDGVAIAAPQLGYLWRIFVISHRAFFNKEDAKDLVFINPEIINQSKDEGLMEEGCLSCRYLYGEVSRKEKTKVRAFNERGEIFEYGGSGLISQVFQHEIDHLNGILFIDKARNLHEIDPKDLNLETN